MSVKKWIKQEKLRELSIKDLRDRAAELKASLFGSRFQRSSGKLDNYRIIPQTRRRLAAVLTLLAEKERAAGAQRLEAKS
jgi:large subunit ribosomal protein L29